MKDNLPFWSPDSWQSFEVVQQASYPDLPQLESVIKELGSLPPLVSVQEIDDLKQKLASAARGESFVLQGGDCAELFSDCNAQAITDKLKILLQMSLVLVYGLNRPVTKIGRMAGQYAKPRSADTETIDGLTLPCYRGDLINGAEFSKELRTPDPKRLLKGYSFASLTLNYIRTLIENKFADFSKIESWDLDFVAHSPLAHDYHEILDKVHGSIDLLKNLSQGSLTNGNTIASVQDKIFTCHEALHLHYEQALTRKSEDDRWYNLSTHLPWIGMRTAMENSAHVEYMRGIANPIAVKIGSKVTPAELLKLCDLLDPDNSPGRLTLISRFGRQHIGQNLPPLIEAVKREKRELLWCSDPMHGNTATTQSGIKTRRFDDIISELTQAFEIHQRLDSHLGGVHFELTGEHVTECVGGARGLTELDLERAYKSLVDPRLNADQSLEMAMQIVKLNQQLKLKSAFSDTE